MSSTPELPDTDCKQSASGSDSPLRRGAVRSYHRFCCYPVFWRGKNDIVTAPGETSPSPPTRTWPLTDTPPRHPRNIGVDHLNVEHEKQLQDDALTRQLLHDDHSVHHAKDEMGSDDEEELLAFCKELRTKVVAPVPDHTRRPRGKKFRGGKHVSKKKSTTITSTASSMQGLRSNVRTPSTQ